MTITFAPGLPPSPSTARRTRWANSPGESSAVSIGWMAIWPESRYSVRSIPSPAVRSRMVSTRSSKAKMMARSPRSAAARAYWMASVDLPLPAGPRRTTLVPY